jgi:hypothetical protein
VLIAAGLWASYLRGFEIPGLHAFRPLPQRYPLVRPPGLSPALAPALAAHAGPLLELPVGTTFFPHVEAMYRSIFHRRPVLNGYSGYWPEGFPARMQLACRLPEPAALAELRRLTDLDTILVHLGPLDRMPPGPGPYGCPRDTPRSAAWHAVATGTRSDLRLVARSGGDLLFAVGP